MQQILHITVESSNVSNSYEIRVPDAGQILDIENLKVAMSLYYRELADKNSHLSNLALDIIDMKAYFTILCPQLLVDLKTPIDKLALPDLIQLRKCFIEQFIPWWNDWIDIIRYIPDVTVDSSTIDEEEEEVDEELPLKKKEEGPHIDLG